MYPAAPVMRSLRFSPITDSLCIAEGSYERWRCCLSAVTIELPENVAEDEARLMLALKLFETARLSLGQAAKMAGYSKATFMEIAGKHGVPVYAYSAEELRREVNR